MYKTLQLSKLHKSFKQYEHFLNYVSLATGYVHCKWMQTTVITRAEAKQY